MSGLRIALLLAWAALGSLPRDALAARADDGLPRAGWKTVQVAVLPVGYYGRTASDLFDEPPVVRRARALAARWHRLLEDGLVGRDQLEVLRSSQVRERLARTAEYRRGQPIAARAHEIGMRSFEAVHADDAQFQFQSALEVFESVWADVVSPSEVSDTAFMLGLTLVERGEANAAHVAFRQALLLDPTRRFERGYYSASTEQGIASAQTDIASRADLLGLRWPVQRLEALAEALAVDQLVVAVVDGPPGAPVLRVALYDRRAKGLTGRARVDLADEDRAALALDRVLAGWQTCAVEANQDRMFRRPARKEWFLDIGYTHGVWLTHRRTRDYIQSAGGQLTVTYEPSPGFQIFGRASQLATLPDANADLIETFVTTRLTLGAGLTLGSEAATFFARTGLEVGVGLSNIQMTTDVDCKFFGANSPRCKTIFEQTPPTVWFGLDFSLGARFLLSSAWYVTISAGVASYIIDPEVTGDLNFPLHGSLGIGVPF